MKDYNGQGKDIADVKAMDMVDYLASLGIYHDPKRSKGNDYWYHSPLRNENTPSFKVNRRIGVWVDYGDPAPVGKNKFNGGNLIEFGIQYFKCSVSEFLSRINSGVIHQMPHVKGEILDKEKESKITISEVKPLTSPALFAYLRKRKIASSVAQRFCVQVHYRNGDKNFYGIGFKSDSGAYEIRSENFKGSNMGKDITTIDNGSKEVAVFEGFFDFLTHMTIHEGQPASQINFVVLNSLSFWEKAQGFILSHDTAHLYLDSNPPGQKIIAQAIKSSEIFRDQSLLYRKHEDLNHWHSGYTKTVKLKRGPHL